MKNNLYIYILIIFGLKFLFLRSPNTTLLKSTGIWNEIYIGIYGIFRWELFNDL